MGFITLPSNGSRTHGRLTRTTNDRSGFVHGSGLIEAGLWSGKLRAPGTDTEALDEKT